MPYRVARRSRSFPPVDLGIVKVRSHLIDQTPTTLLRVGSRCVPLNELYRLVVFQLLQDDPAPYWTVHAFDGERQLKVTL
jgi:hypothetical protein